MKAWVQCLQLTACSRPGSTCQGAVAGAGRAHKDVVQGGPHGLDRGRRVRHALPQGRHAVLEGGDEAGQRAVGLQPRAAQRGGSRG